MSLAGGGANGAGGGVPHPGEVTTTMTMTMTVDWEVPERVETLRGRWGRYVTAGRVVVT